MTRCFWRLMATVLALTLGVAGATAQQTTAQPQAPDAVLQRIVVHAVSYPDGRAPHSFVASDFDDDLRQLPIGVFDSGIGGLTVLEAILALDAFDNQSLQPGADGRPDFQHERFVYFGDQANMPYGNYAAAGKEDYLRELILKDTAFLLGRRYFETPDARQPQLDKPPVKAIVIACNTATAYGLEDVRSAVQAWQLPVIVVGVVEAGAQGVMRQIEGTRGSGAVAVLATTGTCSSMAYPKAIGRTVGLAGKRPPQVIQQGSVGLAGAIEGDPTFIAGTRTAESRSSWAGYQGPATDQTSALLNPEYLQRYQFDASGLLGSPSRPETLALNSIDNYVRYEVTSLVENYRRNGGGEPISMVVLGCTHFPLVEAEITAAFARLRRYEEAGQRPYESLIAETIRIIDPAELTAKELFRSLAKNRLRADVRKPLAVENDLFFLSVPSPAWPGVRLDRSGGLDRQYKYGRTPGRLTVEDTRSIPLTPALLPETSLSLIQTHLPEVWRRLQ